MSVPQIHLSTELAQTGRRVDVNTRFGPITGGRALNGAAAFLEVPYALPPGRFEDPICLPSTYRYEEQKAYIHESLYGVQPDNDGQAGDGDPRNKLGLGKPTENPLFLNIVAPPGFPSKRGFPVKIYIHGGFLQFGSPHGLSGQAQYVAAERGEVYVNPGYRLSAFGFLASDSPPIPGNFGFKDLWLALEWIRDNIADFGGDPTNITLTGLSAGAHAAHQLLHHASRLPRGVNAPFQRAVLQSNAIATNPKTPAELRVQYLALLRSVEIDPSSPSAYATLSNDAFTTASLIAHSVSSTIAPEHGTFRGTSDSSFLPANEMQWQASGGFARALHEKGVKSIVVGEVAEEWYLYSIAHPVENAMDVRMNLERYYQDNVVDRLLRYYPPLSEHASKEDCVKLFGRILSDSQVHLPIRLLHRDLQSHGFPVVRYRIGWTPPQYRPKGYVTHATDRPIWAFRLDVLTPQQLPLVRSWLDAVVSATKEVEVDGNERPTNEILTLREDGIGWEKDDRWAEMERLAKVVEGTGEGAVKGKL